MPLERPFVYVFEFPFHTNVCMLKLSSYVTSDCSIRCSFVLVNINAAANATGNFSLKKHQNLVKHDDAETGTGNRTARSE
jgi:hypothetical protein